MSKFDVEPLPERAGYVTVEILEDFDIWLASEVIYMEEAEADEKLKEDKTKDKLIKITKFKSKDVEK